MSLALFLAAAVQTTPMPAAAQQCRIVLQGANVWNGATFEKRDLAIDGARFVAAAPAGAVSVPAGWAYLLPPLVDAHTHTVDEAPATGDATHRRHLDAGIFYAFNPNNLRTPGATPAPSAEQVELIATGGGITGPGGHPRPLYESLARNGRLGRVTLADLPGRAFHEAATPDAARAGVRAVAASGAKFVKLYLLDHDGARSGGLNRAAFEAAATEARRLKLRAVVHVETAADFRLAIANRVAGLVHMPGYISSDRRPSETWRLTPADAAAAKAADITIVTTVYPAFVQLDGERLRVAQATQTHNLTLLRDAGVALAAGADTYAKSVVDELTLLRATTLFDGAALIRMATQNGAQLAMPDRRVGRLAPGYEASFLLLYADPTRSWGALSDPLTGMRGGRTIFDKARLLPAGCLR